MRRFTIDLKGPLHGIEFGGEGRLVLLVHGLSGSAVNWVELADGLTAYGRVVAPELPGFGRTPPAGRRASIEAQAEILAEFIRRQTDEPALIVGNSMGAMATMILAGRYPELVSRLVLINSPAPSPSAVGIAPVWMLVMVLYLIPGLNKALLTWLHNQGSPEERTEAGIDMIAARAERIPRSTRLLHAQVTAERNTMPWTHEVHLEAYRSIVRTLVPYSRFDQMVRRITVPTLLIHGTMDLVVPIAAAERLASLRPDWMYRPMVEVGHIPMMESPELCLELIGEFMAATGLSPESGTGAPTAFSRNGAADSRPGSVRAARY
ncbi:MAG: alpha/beta hydrolase [bacterium]|nr:alpha/beta hydrolase [bacterium]MDE0288337.1 alpha/beta hydrolase [bacterium]MDE0437866.1 alpha/beta hydrolase [bacterium]